MSEASPALTARLRIGDLAAATGASPRMLRHYEKCGLLEADRSSTGQRIFDAAAVDRVRHIRALLAVGLPLRLVAELIDCVQDRDRIEPCAVPVLADHLRGYDRRIAELATTRQALQGLIDSAG